MYKLISCTLLVVFHVSITLGHLPIYTHYDPYTRVELQCDQCPPGTFVRYDCTAEKRTECAPCPSNYFTNEWNSYKDCQYCSTICKELQVSKQECSSTTNRICQCIDGFFLDVEFCSPHKECPPGYGVVQQGTPHSDTVCGECPKGMFSNVTSSTAPCQRQTDCKKLGRKVLHKGSSTQDTVCKEESASSCEIDVTLCEEALFRFPAPPENWIMTLIQRFSSLALTSQQINKIQETHDAKEQPFYLFKLYKSQSKADDSFTPLIKDLKECEKGVFNLLGPLNLTSKNAMILMQSLPGKRIRPEDIEKTLKTCERPKDLIKLLSLWRNKNKGNTIEGLKLLKMRQLPKVLRKRMKKLGQFLSGDSMYSLYQKIILEINGNTTQAVKLESLL
ncbi:tumor necrosis factor receptor superfamily member 11B [Hyla sarda]|uniref:tumor necrosis factor receptor superfamily member 11B n=1 Tax=Hyla sarda TaxID=327740 RepID=UPI0024C2254A|nr:tumor necrosis factor receptor superfamily member 11B [Hyla sarda]